MNEGGYCRKPSIGSWGGGHWNPMAGPGLLNDGSWLSIGGDGPYVGMEAAACTISESRLGSREQGTALGRGLECQGESLNFSPCLPLLGSLIFLTFSYWSSASGWRGLGGNASYCYLPSRALKPASSWTPETIWALEIIIRGAIFFIN